MSINIIIDTLREIFTLFYGNDKISYVEKIIYNYEIDVFNKLIKTKISWQKVVPIGLIAGFLVLVRNQDLVVVLPILVGILFAKKESLLDKS